MTHISPMLAREMIFAAPKENKVPECFVFSAVQALSLLNHSCTVTISAVQEGQEAPQRGSFFPTTCCGLPLNVDWNMPEDQVELRDSAGKVLAKLSGLSLPNL